MIKKIVKYLLVLFFGNKLRILKMTKGLFKGIFLEIDIKNQLSLIFGSPELHLQQTIQKYIKAGDTVFDIGANIGYVSIAMSRVVGDIGKVYSFEAIPSTAQRCKRNIVLNNCKNIKLLNKAVSDECIKTVFRIPEGGDAHSIASMVWHKNITNTAIVKVDTIVIDLDEQLKDLTPSFVKIDVEGAEGKVISGMQNLVAKKSPIIFIECSQAGKEIVWDILKNKNEYNCFNAISHNEILNIDDYHSNDFIWIPKHK